LIGEQVEARLFMDHVEVWYGQKKVAEMPREFGNLAWPTSAVCFGPPFGTLMLRELGSAGA
jgi:hypothetical protein